MRNERGFTLIELILIIVVLGIMAALAIPKFLDMRADAKKAAVQGALGGVRSANANWKSNQIVKGLSPPAPEYPTAVQLGTVGTVMDGPLPDNPYSTNTPKNVVSGCATAKGVIDAASPDAWCYIPTTGDFWANSSVAGENAL